MISLARLSRSIGPALIALAAASPASAEWPERPIRMVIIQAAGGSPDFVGRIVGEQLALRLKQPVVIENTSTPSIAALNSQFVKAEPDGYKIALITSGAVTTAAIQKTMPFDLATDITPITFLTRYPLLVVVPTNSPYKTLQELVDASKAKTPGLTVATTLQGTLLYFLAELINMEAKANLRPIPYRASSQMLTDLLAGRVDAMVFTATTAIPQIESGALRALAVSSAERYAPLPQVPTVAEIYKGVTAPSWLGLVGPPNLPAPILERLNREVRGVLEMPEVREALARQGNDAAPSTPDEMRQRMLQEVSQWRRVVIEKNMEQQ